VAVTEKIVVMNKSSAANGIVLLGIAVYLGVVVWNGNLEQFINTLWDDITGKGPHGYAFWQWGLAVVILLYLATFDSLQGPMDTLLIIAFVALLIQLATKQPQLFKNLNSALSGIFGT
jgi:hypothetical protein